MPTAIARRFDYFSTDRVASSTSAFVGNSSASSAWAKDFAQISALPLPSPWFLTASVERDEDADDDYYDNPYRQSSSMPMEDYTLITVRYVFAVLYSVLFLIGLANVLVLFIVARFSRMRTVTNVFIFNLCLADLVYVTFLPFVVCFQLLRSWIFGEFMCKIFFIAESTTKFASVYFVGVLSVDRYLALCHPSWCKRHRNPVLAIIISAVGWLITAALMTPIYLYSTVIRLTPTLLMCTVKWPIAADAATNFTDSSTNDSDSFQDQQQKFTSEHYFAIYSFIFCFGAPLIVIISFYFKILEELIRANERAARLKKRKEQTYKKVTRMVLSVVTFYFICWSPFWIMSFVSTFVLRSPPTTAVRILFNVIHALPYLNCSINPILYSLMTENFRIILGEVFPWTPCFGRGSVAAAGGSAGGGPNGRASKHRSVAKRRYNDDEAIDDSQFLRSSFSHSVRLMSNVSVNLTSANGHSTNTISVSASSVNSGLLAAADSTCSNRNLRALSVV